MNLSFLISLHLLRVRNFLVVYNFRVFCKASQRIVLHINAGIQSSSRIVFPGGGEAQIVLGKE